MGRSRRGSGSVFQRTYRDAKGKLRKTKNWYIEFVAGNRTIREATDFTNRTDAAEFLKKRISDALGGKIVLSQGMVATMPYIAMLAEHNVRKGFFELDQFQAILKHLNRPSPMNCLVI